MSSHVENADAVNGEVVGTVPTRNGLASVLHRRKNLAVPKAATRKPEMEPKLDAQLEFRVCDETKSRLETLLLVTRARTGVRRLSLGDLGRRAIERYLDSEEKKINRKLVNAT
jgi:hypothetical protein